MEGIAYEEKIRLLEQDLKSLRAKNKKTQELTLQESERPDVKEGIKKDGKAYTVRNNRDRFFFPGEWIKFFDSLKTPQQRITFEFLINTGARINEARNVKIRDIDIDNKRLILRVTKVKSKKKEKAPRPRQISISSHFTRRLNKYIRNNKLSDEDYIGLLSTPAANIALKKELKSVKINDYYMFSIHNIRKTHGNWLKALGIDAGEICTRLGHDYNTFLKSYSSPDIFTYQDRQDIRLILGDLYYRKI